MTDKNKIRTSVDVVKAELQRIRNSTILAEGELVKILGALNVEDPPVCEPPVEDPPVEDPPVEDPPIDDEGQVTIPSGMERVTVTPGVSSSFINNVGNGKAIVFEPGVYQGLSIKPKPNQVYFGDPKNPEAVELRGGNYRAFQGFGDAPNVLIAGLRLRAYQTGMGDKFTSQPWGSSQDTKAQIAVIEDASPNWVIDSCLIEENYCTGIRMGNGTVVNRVIIRKNGHVGILVGRAVEFNRAFDTIVKRSFIEDNCRFNMNKTWDSGGIKYIGGSTPGGRSPALKGANNNKVLSTVIRGNNGPGIWFDWDLFDNEVAGCSIYGNHASGIVIEGSAAHHVHHNQIGLNCVGSLPKLVSFRCNTIGVQNSKLNRIYKNLFVIDRENIMAITQHNRKPGTPQGGTYVGWFTGTENEFDDNVYLVLDTSAGFVEQYNNHDCHNPNRNCTGVSCSNLCGTSARGCKVDAIPTGPVLDAANRLCFIPGAGDDHFNVSRRNTYRTNGGTAKHWPFEQDAKNGTDANDYIPSDWQQVPEWDEPPGSL